MEKRKLQKTGGKSITLTLPKPWIKANELTEKDEVLLAYRNNGSSLVIQPATNLIRWKKSKMNSSKLSTQELKREIISQYISGFEQLTVHEEHLTNTKRVAIKSVTEMLIGIEIIEDLPDRVVLKNILDPTKFSTKFSTKKMLETMFSMTKSMFEDAISTLNSNKPDLNRDIIERDSDIDKFYFLLLRQNRSKLKKKITEESDDMTFEQAFYHQSVATQLERIADHAVKIAKFKSENQHLKVDSETKANIEHISSEGLKLLTEASLFVQNIDKDAAHRAIANCSKIEKKLSKVTYTTKTTALLFDSIDRLRGYVANMAELTIDQAVSETT